MFTFLIKLVSLKIKVYRASYAYKNTHYLGLFLPAHNQIQKFVSHSSYVQLISNFIGILS